MSSDALTVLIILLSCLKFPLPWITHMSALTVFEVEPSVNAVANKLSIRFTVNSAFIVVTLTLLTVMIWYSYYRSIFIVSTIIFHIIIVSTNERNNIIFFCRWYFLFFFWYYDEWKTVCVCFLLRTPFYSGYTPLNLVFPIKWCIIYYATSGPG